MIKLKRTNTSPPAIPELLAPAGSYEKLVTAVHYGADAVYLGGKEFSLRAKANNFTLEVMEQGVKYGHEHGVKVYVTVNIIAHNQDLEAISEYLPKLSAIGVDGIIVADPGLLRCAQKVVPTLPIHLSTQANVTNKWAATFWGEQGVSRMNLARELSLEEIRAIRKNVVEELEVFVHGALCISYSGRCMLSNYLTGRDANQGSCAHPCRFSYSLVEEKRPGEYFPVEEDDRGTYIFNSKDLCLLEKLPLLVDAGVDSLKIEGRMKSIFYVGGVVRVYRAALDYLSALPSDAWEEPEKISLPETFLKEIRRTGTRGSTENFIDTMPGGTEMIYASSRMEQTYEPVAVVRQNCESGGVFVEIRNTVKIGEEIEYMSRNIETELYTIKKMEDSEGQQVSKANPGNQLQIFTEPNFSQVEKDAILRRRKKSTVSAKVFDS